MSKTNGTEVPTGRPHGQHDRLATDEVVSFFVPSLTTGGAEQVTVNIVNGLAARGYDVELLLSRFEGSLKPQLSTDVKVVDLWPARTLVFGVATHLPALVSYLRSEEPAVLFSHLTHVSIACLVADRIVDGDTAVIPTEHLPLSREQASSHKSRISRRLVLHLYPTAHQIVAVSEGVADSIADRTSVPRERISVLHNPIEVESVRQRAREQVDHEWLCDNSYDVMLFVGRIERQKDLETWLRTLARVRIDNPDARGIIVGKGSRRATVQELVETLGLSDVVSMPGYVDNPYAYMRRADVFLLSSRYEGLPTVLIEALACGCSVVATDCPTGPGEILADGAYGRLAPVGDVDGLANAVLHTLKTPTDTESLLARADDFRPESVLNDYEQFIRRCVAP